VTAPEDEWIADLTKDLPRTRLGRYWRWFRPGRCALCGKWTLFLLRGEDAHEACWLNTK